MANQFVHRLYPLGYRELTLVKLWISVQSSVKPWFVSFFVLGVVAEFALKRKLLLPVSMMWSETTDRTLSP